jgi:hypothetical protein
MNGPSFIGFSSKHIVLMNDFQRKLVQNDPRRELFLISWFPSFPSRSTRAVDRVSDKFGYSNCINLRDFDESVTKPLHN